MELTKEECEKALKGIDSHLDNEYDEHDNKLTAYFSWHLITLENLIKKHFSNPPLKFEELKEGMWVWDDKEKTYLKIYIIEILSGVKFVHFDIKNLMTSVTEFEEGRFFAKEVSDGN